MTRPNILLIQADQLSASALRAYGHGVTLTPTIDALAGRGLVFEQAYSNFPVCAPSRCAMMAGRLASAIEAYDNAAEFRASIPTMAHYLRDLDYDTTLCGKMHFIGPDLLHGYEERLTPEIYSSDFLTLPNWDEVERDDFASDAFQALVEAGPAPRTVQMDYDEEVAFRAKQKLYDLARREEPRPFFLTVSFTHPHEPYICRQEFWDLYRDRPIDQPAVGRFEEAELDGHSRRLYRHYNLSSPEITAEHVARARRAYYGSLSYVDSLIGQVLGVAGELGLLETTLVVFTSDHGDMLGERGLWFKKTLFDKAIRVPFIVAGPGIATGRTARNVSLVDLLPTFVEAAQPGAESLRRASLDGNSLWPLLRGEGEDWPDRAFAEVTCEGVVEPVVMVKEGGHKYIFSASVEPLLFDLPSDPRELTNLAGRPESRALEARMQSLIAERWGDLDRLRERILTSQRERAMLCRALAKGKLHSWDDNDPTSGGDRYLRAGKSYNAWNYSGVDRLRDRSERADGPEPAAG